MLVDRPRDESVRVIHTVAGTRPEHGGPSRSVPALCEALSERGLRVELVTRDGGSPGPILPGGSARVHLVGGRSGPARLLEVVEFARVLKGAIRDADLVHDHGAWLWTNWMASLYSRRAGVPLVISPRGMLTRWALEFRRSKKSAAWSLYQKRALRSARVIHVTAEAEADDLWNKGVDVPVAVVPNGVRVPDRAPGPRAGTPRRALFLSRIHPKKGIPTLVEAWARVRPEEWTLTVAGPDDGGHRGVVEEAIQRHGMADTVHLRGGVPEGEKWDLYSQADLFVLPSWSENFGIVVAEALGSGIPVITTKAAPWESIEREGCGWWIDTGVEPLARALEEATRASDQRRREMGLRGRELVRREYSWERAARRMQAVYDWVAGVGPRPEWVVERER